MLQRLANVDVSRELVDASDGGSESASGLVHSRTSKEGSFRRWLKAQKNHNYILDQYIHVEIRASVCRSDTEE